jgi:hypothetical protein
MAISRMVKGMAGEYGVTCWPASTSCDLTRWLSVAILGRNTRTPRYGTLLNRIVPPLG